MTKASDRSARKPRPPASLPASTIATVPNARRFGERFARLTRQFRTVAAR